MGNMSNAPRELDWVKERAACTVAQIFSQLHQGVENDVKSVNLARECIHLRNLQSLSAQTARVLR